MKRLISLLLIVAVGGLLSLAGCKDDGKKPETGTPKKAPTSQPAVPKAPATQHR